MKIYIICPVRKASSKEVKQLREYVKSLTDQGHEVFLPNDHVPQDDPIGEKLVKIELDAIKDADEVHVWWHVNSSGSHFDLGVALALNKPLKLVHEFIADGEGKSYSKVMKVYERKGHL